MYPICNVYPSIAISTKSALILNLDGTARLSTRGIAYRFTTDIVKAVRQEQYEISYVDDRGCAHRVGFIVVGDTITFTNQTVKIINADFRLKEV